MHEFDDSAEAMRSCARCGGNAFYWRTAVVAGNPAAPGGSSLVGNTHHQPAWTCMTCGLIEPHERRVRPASALVEERRNL
jgi:hypothetical protein